MVVPVNTSVLLSCEVHYAGSYFVQWKRDSDEHPFDSNPPVVNSSIITHTLSVTDEYKNAMIHCIVRAVNHTVESNSIKVNAVSEGNS